MADLRAWLQQTGQKRRVCFQETDLSRASTRRRSAPTVLEQCPICRRQIPSIRLVAHVNECLDNPPRTRPAMESTMQLDSPPRRSPAGSMAPPPVKSPTPASDSRVRAHPRLVGNYIIEDLLLPSEEEALLTWLGQPGDPRQCAPEWRERYFNGPAYGKAWGVRTNLKQRTQDAPLHPMPEQLRFVVTRLREMAGFLLGADWLPTEANAIDYRRQRGHFLGAHLDDRSLSGAILVNLCLAGDSVMTYTRERGKGTPTSGALSRPLPEHERVHLPRRSAQIQLGPCRFHFTHGIANEDLMHDRRVSITFRRGAYVPGGGPEALWGSSPL
mmetsp:Transcript_14518/g.44238  ORF Transcript_14518/g.44238 Transcript_14518/m.44238 type:complete len:328 (-) Transcript_14518:157-1140(-)